MNLTLVPSTLDTNHVTKYHSSSECFHLKRRVSLQFESTLGEKKNEHKWSQLRNVEMVVAEKDELKC